MLSHKHLDWDSDFFALPIAHIIAEDPSAAALEEALSTLQSEGIALVYLFLSTPLSIEPNSIGMSDMGGKVLYHKQLTKAPDYHPQIASYPSGNTVPKLYELALQSGVYSRFKLDTKLPKGAYERLYRTWIEKSVQRIISDELFVYNIAGKIAGMLTLSQKADWGDIGLIAVDSAYRGQKIGHHLLNAAYKYFYDLGITDLGVETQTQNEGACRFYESNGFRVHKTELIYHVWL
jgi:dTDP-4-amino-4,6-dideoxy-D-galactose acyltransferase